MFIALLFFQQFLSPVTFFFVNKVNFYKLNIFFAFRTFLSFFRTQKWLYSTSSHYIKSTETIYKFSKQNLVLIIWENFLADSEIFRFKLTFQYISSHYTKTTPPIYEVRLTGYVIICDTIFFLNLRISTRGIESRKTI